MKNEKTRITITVIASLLLMSIAHAQPLANAGKIKGQPEPLAIKRSEVRKKVDFTKPAEGTVIKEENHLSWLMHHVLQTGTDVSFQLRKTESDQQGFTHYRYAQQYQSVPVEYGVYYVHIRNGKVESANGEYYDHISVSTIAKLTKEDAFVKALSEVPSKEYNTAVTGDFEKMKNAGELVVLPVNDRYYLTYKFDIYSLQPLKRVYVYIDANTGQKIKEVSRIHETDVPGTAVTAYNGTVSMTTDLAGSGTYRLRASKNFGGLRTMNLNNKTNFTSAANFTDADNIWNTTGIDKYATDAHFGAEATYDWYLSRFGRNSYDNAGSAIISYVHYDNYFVNAFWDGTAMSYGDGDGTYYTPLTSLDIVGHEITHGVTEFSAGLIYAGESGALNESFSDIFGVTIDYFKNPATANFLMAEQVSLSGVPFRNMSNPNQYSNPDTYGGTFWNAPNEVHNNSGVQNFWYYLLCMGGSGTNDLGHAYTVNPLSMNDASAIAYRNLTVYLTPNSNYADARFYSVQAAVDLFGACSSQVQEVVNAWYAVGVGNAYTTTVTADFAADRNFLCTVPATVNFTNLSFNASTYSWNFGDGSTSTVMNPSHNYTVAGTYTVTLTANGVGICNGTNTLVLTDYIHVNSSPAVGSPACTPVSLTNCCGIGITKVKFGMINHSTGDGSEGYQDYTCSQSTNMIAGDPVELDITASNIYYEYISAWIDYNNDGLFDEATERVANGMSNHGSYKRIVNTSLNAILNTPLRMRITDDNLDQIADACYNSEYGQSEDYTIIFKPNTLPPVANFTSDLILASVGQPVHFTDLTQHAPTSWQWSFSGADQTTSSLQNPAAVYSTVGLYEVKLVVTNSFGADSITRTSYINVVNSINMCNGIASTTEETGLFYDSGGPDSTYQGYEICSLLIEPDCAQSVTLTFSEFEVDWMDNMAIYDGPGPYAKLLYSFSGTSFPQSVKSNTGKMFVAWESLSLGSYYPGWKASWTSVITVPNPPAAAFLSSSSNAPLNSIVQFTDASLNSPASWQWDFGDGYTSSVQNPVHQFTTPGTFMVQLIISNCTGIDSITQVIGIQNAPVDSITMDSLIVQMNCLDSVTIPILIYNTGSGDLCIAGNLSANGIVRDSAILIIQDIHPYGVDLSGMMQAAYGITPVIIRSDQIDTTNFSKYDLIITTGDQHIDYYNQVSMNLAKFESFVASGGTVEYDFGGYYALPKNYLVNNAVMSRGNEEYKNLNLVPTHPLFTGIPTVMKGSFMNYCFISALPPGAVVLSETKDSHFPTTIEYSFGLGKVIATGMLWEYFAAGGNTTCQQLLKNSIDYALSAITDLPPWISLTPATVTIPPGDSAIIYVSFYADNLSNGTYNSNLILHTNNASHPVISIPVEMTINNLSAAFTVTGNLNAGQNLQFSPTATGITSCNWDFGDGSSSSQITPIHNYNSTGDFVVSLTASKDSCTDIFSDTLHVGPTGVFNPEKAVSLNAFPNPFSHVLQLTYELSHAQNVSLKAMDALGREVQIFEQNKIQQPGKHSYQFNPTSAGIYFVEFKTNEGTNVFKVIKVDQQ